MTSEDLAQEVSEFVLRASERVLGTGDRQYSKGETQAFESKDPDGILQDMEEELLDFTVYAVQLWLRMQELRRLVDGSSAIAEEDFGELRLLEVGSLDDLAVLADEGLAV